LSPTDLGSLEEFPFKWASVEEALIAFTLS